MFFAQLQGPSRERSLLRRRSTRSSTSTILLPAHRYQVVGPLHALIGPSSTSTKRCVQVVCSYEHCPILLAYDISILTNIDKIQLGPLGSGEVSCPHSWPIRSRDSTLHVLRALSSRCWPGIRNQTAHSERPVASGTRLLRCTHHTCGAVP